MLENSFCHLPTVGLATETRLWKAGIHDWDALEARGEQVLSPAKLSQALAGLATARERLAAGDAGWFGRKLPASETWRLFDLFRDSVAYVDIETTGMGNGLDHITCIGLYDGQTVRTYVHGRNLDDFERDVFDYKLLVTFNGRSFDAPFIERDLKIKLDHAHIDLRWVLKPLGFTGGLKRIEKAMGLNRGEVDGLDGYHAVLLWREFKRSGCERTLETLLAYNVADILGLEPLMRRAYALAAGRLAVPGGPLPVLPPDQPGASCLGANPYRADPEVVRKLLAVHPGKF